MSDEDRPVSAEVKAMEDIAEGLNSIGSGLKWIACALFIGFLVLSSDFDGFVAAFKVAFHVH